MLRREKYSIFFIAAEFFNYIIICIFNYFYHMYQNNITMNLFIFQFTLFQNTIRSNLNRLPGTGCYEKYLIFKTYRSTSQPIASYPNQLMLSRDVHRQRTTAVTLKLRLYILKTRWSRSVRNMNYELSTAFNKVTVYH